MLFIFQVIKSIHVDHTAWSVQFGSPDPVAEFKIDTFQNNKEGNFINKYRCRVQPRIPLDNEIEEKGSFINEDRI